AGAGQFHPEAVSTIASIDPAEGWKDMLRRRREVSRNTVDGIKRHAHDGDYAFIRGQFIKKLGDNAYIFSDGKDRLEVRFAPGTVPKDFTLNADYMLWGQMHRENVILAYMQVLLLSPRRMPPPNGVHYQGVPPCEGRNCRMPMQAGQVERAPYIDEDDASKAGTGAQPKEGGDGSPKGEATSSVSGGQAASGSLQMPSSAKSN
ncbi:MAG: hypothetical protein ACI4NA_07355, partial [Succinivibrio sp.]